MEHFGKFLHATKESVAKVRGKFIDHCNQMSGRKYLPTYTVLYYNREIFEVSVTKHEFPGCSSHSTTVRSHKNLLLLMVQNQEIRSSFIPRKFHAIYSTIMGMVPSVVHT